MKTSLSVLSVLTFLLCSLGAQSLTPAFPVELQSMPSVVRSTIDGNLDVYSLHDSGFLPK